MDMDSLTITTRLIKILNFIYAYKDLTIYYLTEIEISPDKSSESNQSNNDRKTTCRLFLFDRLRAVSIKNANLVLVEHFLC